MDYLVKHQYIDPLTANLKRKDLHLSQSLPEATLRNLVASHAGLNNAVSFNCVGAPEVVLDEQFTAFKHFLRTECLPTFRSVGFWDRDGRGSVLGSGWTGVCFGIGVDGGLWGGGTV